MAAISKEYLRNAFITKKGKRRQLLYEFYKEELFSNGHYSADFIADSISTDLGIVIERSLIYQINARIAKKDKQANSTKSQPLGKKENTPEKIPTEASEFVFRNADDLPKRDPIKEAMAHLTRKKE